MDGMRSCIGPLANIINDFGNDFEDDLGIVFDEDLAGNLESDMGYSPDEFGYNENEGAEW